MIPIGFFRFTTLERSARLAFVASACPPWQGFSAASSIFVSGFQE
jgi:hypothetical protein